MAAAEVSPRRFGAGFWRNLKSIIWEPKYDLESSSTSYSSAISEFEVEATNQYAPATCSGFGELPLKTALVIMLLWLPRFFIPWIEAWHRHDILVLAHTELVKPLDKELFIHKLILFCGTCSITLFVSFFAGVLNQERSTYLILLILYTSCPVAGGCVNTVLRYRLYDGDLYPNWYLQVAMMRWTMAIPFIFFPVQMSSIFYETENMSKQAHYNWVGFFAFFELLNAHLAYWGAPGNCPTTGWMEIAVWIAVGMALYTVALLTTIFFFWARDLRLEIADCMSSCVYKEEAVEIEDGSETSCSTALKVAVCYLCIFVSVVYAFFALAILKRYVRNVDWDNPKPWSATGILNIGRAIGVVVMMILITVIRRYGKKITRLRLLSPDVLVLGLPHLFASVAFLLLISRIRPQPQIVEGEVIKGAAPDQMTAVLVFFNLIYRNRTVCISSEHFRTLQIRPLSHATRTLRRGMGEITVTVTPEPDSIPSIATTHKAKVGHSGWVPIVITVGNDLPSEEDGETKLKNYYTTPTVTNLHIDPAETESLPQLPLVFIFNTLMDAPTVIEFSVSYHLNQSEQSQSELAAKEEGSAQLWNVRENLGNWSVWMKTKQYGQFGPRFDFHLDNHSVYFLASYLYAPRDVTPDYQQPMTFSLFKIAEFAGPERSQLYKPLRETSTVWAGLILAGMAAGGFYTGIIYMFWIEPFIATTMRFAVIWVLTGAATAIPNIKQLDLEAGVNPVVSDLQIVFTFLHFVGALILYRPQFDRRIRPD